MVSEAPFEKTKEGLVPAGGGWFVLNAQEARWFNREGQGVAPGLQGRGDFRQLGMGLDVLAPGEPMAMYHWETDREDFLVLAGEALLVIEGEERPLRRWDFVHCPAGTKHVIVGAGEAPCAVLAVGAREHHTVHLPDGGMDGGPGLGRLHRGRGRTPTRRGRRGGDDRRGRRLRSLSRARANPISRRLASEQLDVHRRDRRSDAFRSLHGGFDGHRRGTHF